MIRVTCSTGSGSFDSGVSWSSSFWGYYRGVYQSVCPYVSLKTFADPTIRRITVRDGFISNSSSTVAHMVGMVIPNDPVSWYNKGKKFTLNPVVHIDTDGTLNVPNRYNEHIKLQGINPFSNSDEWLIEDISSQRSFASFTANNGGCSGYFKSGQRGSVCYGVMVLAYGGIGSTAVTVSAMAGLPSIDGNFAVVKRGRWSRTGNFRFAKYGLTASEHGYQEILHIEEVNQWASECVESCISQAESSSPWRTDHYAIDKSQSGPTYDEMRRIANYAYSHGNSVALQAMQNRKRIDSHSLSYEALQNIGICDNNGLAYLKDTLEIGKAFTSFASTLRSLPKSKVKSAASLYLAAHYGFKLQFLDTREYMNYLSSHSLNELRIRRASSLFDSSFAFEGQSCRAITRYTVFYDTIRDLVDQTEAIRRYLDLDLTLENAWDMVPWSFVIDWFSNVGNWLTALDNYRNVASTYSTVGACQSVKGEIDLDLSNLEGRDVTGDLTAKFYLRVVSPTASIPIPSKINSSQTSPLKHVLEGASLAVTAL